MRDLDVVLCGYYGFHNLGDDLLAESILMLLERCGIKKEKVGILSAAPAESEELLGITAVNRWRIGDVYRLLKRSRTLLLGGGGLFQDTTSIRSCLYYWGVVLLATMVIVVNFLVDVLYALIDPRLRTRNRSGS